MYTISSPTSYKTPYVPLNASQIMSAVPLNTVKIEFPKLLIPEIGLPAKVSTKESWTCKNKN